MDPNAVIISLLHGILEKVSVNTLSISEERVRLLVQETLDSRLDLREMVNRISALEKLNKTLQLLIDHNTLVNETQLETIEVLPTEEATPLDIDNLFK